MRVLETAARIDLPDWRIAVCGDWHGNVAWLRLLAPAIRALAPDVTTILQLGDWWMNPHESDRILRDSGIERVLVTLGNHEAWGQLSPLLHAHPGQAIRISEVTWLLPRPHRFRIGGRQILSLGGAASLDREWRIEGQEWWRDEEITDEHVQAAIAGGHADVLVTHESLEDTPVRAIQDILRLNPLGFRRDALAASAASRARVQAVWDAVQPALMMHGHFHAPGSGVTDDGRHVVSVGADGQDRSLVLLDLDSLIFERPSLLQMRAAAGQAS